MKNNYVDLIMNECVSIMAERRQRLIDDNKCPICNRKMNWNEEISIACNYIIQNCECGYNRLDGY